MQAEVVAELEKNIAVTTSNEIAGRSENFANQANIAEVCIEIEKNNGMISTKLERLMAEIHLFQNTMLKWYIGATIAFAGMIIALVLRH